MARERPVYVMIQPSASARPQLGACRRAHGLTERYPLDRLHCTMLQLGDVRDRPPSEWREIEHWLASFSAEPIDLAFDTLDGRLLRGASGSGDAARFHNALRSYLISRGVRLRPQGFWLHLSLAYDGPERPRTAIVPIAWRADRFLMIQSIHGAGHEQMGSWPLTERQLSLAL